jgi:hypothetical protein
LPYSEVIANIRESLGQGRIIILTQNGQVVPSNTSDELEGEIGYTVQSRIEITLTLRNAFTGTELLNLIVSCRIARL